MVTRDEALPPAGWYDDPSGSGGRRYWNGRNWTDQVQEGTAAKARPAATRGRTASADRLPDGYMLLNGRRVPLGQISTPGSPTSAAIGTGPDGNLAAWRALPAEPRRSSLIIGVAVVGMLALSSLISAFIPFVVPEDPDTVTISEPVDATVVEEQEEDAGLTYEIDSDRGPLDVGWYDGEEWHEETGVDPGWTLAPGIAEGLHVQVARTDPDIGHQVVCRITNAEGRILVQEWNGASPEAVCRW